MIPHLLHRLLWLSILIWTLLALGQIVQTVSWDLLLNLTSTISLAWRSVFSEHNDFVLSFWELPATKDKKVRADSCAGMTISLSRRVAYVAALLPWHGLCIPDHEIVTRVLLRSIMKSCCSLWAWIQRPSSKQQDLTTWDVNGMTKAAFRWLSRYSQAGPNEGVSVEDSDVWDIAWCNGSSLTKTTDL